MKSYPKKRWEPELRDKRSKITRTGGFTNAQGLNIRWYSWEVKKPKCAIIFAHGLGVYGSFEMLASVPPGTPRVHYSTSWPERMNARDASLFCIDHQGHGRSDSAVKGKRCYFHRLDDLVNDFGQFCELLRDDLGGDVPVFVVGSSLGGFVATKTMMESPKAANGLVTLAPMLSLDALSNRPINRVLIPIGDVLSALVPTVPIVKTHRNVKFPLTQKEVEDDALTWPSGVRNTRVRVASEAYKNTLKLKKPGTLERITCPVLAFHGRDDPMTDPRSSSMLYERVSCADKRLQWVDGVFHDLCHEKPSSDQICDEIIEWCLARISGPILPKAAKRARESDRGAESVKRRAKQPTAATSKTKSTPRRARSRSSAR